MICLMLSDESPSCSSILFDTDNTGSAEVILLPCLRKHPNAEATLYYHKKIYKYFYIWHMTYKISI